MRVLALIFILIIVNGNGQTVQNNLQLAEDSLMSNPAQTIQILEAISVGEMIELDSAFFYYYTLGVAQTAVKQFEGGKKFLTLAKREVENTTYYKKQHEVLEQLGKNANLRADYDTSLKYFLEQLHLARTKYEKGLTMALKNVGVAKYYLSNFQGAFEYFKKAKIEAVKTNHPNTAQIMRNVAAMYYEIDPNQADSSILLMQQAIATYPANDLEEKATAYSLLGRYYLYNKVYDSALYCLSEGLRMGKLSGDYDVYTITLSQLSSFYIEMKDFNTSLRLLREARGQFDSLKNYEGLAFVDRKMADVYVQLQNADSVYSYLYKAQRARDSLFNKQRAQGIAEMEVKYESALKDQQLSESNLLLIKNRNRLLLLGVLLLLVIIAALIWFYYTKASQRKMIDEVKIKEQDRSIRAVLSAQEEERERIARELHDGIGQYMSAILMSEKQLINKDIPADLKEAVQQNINLIESTRKEIREISHEMMPATLTEVGMVAAIRQMLELGLGLYSISYTYEPLIDEHKRYDKNIEIGIYRICQELVQNIIKHAQPKEVSVNLYERNNHLHLLVEDDGVGFTENKVGDGIGITNLKTRLNLMHGGIKLESEEGAGTLVIIKIPLV